MKPLLRFQDVRRHAIVHLRLLDRLDLDIALIASRQRPLGIDHKACVPDHLAELFGVAGDPVFKAAAARRVAPLGGETGDAFIGHFASVGDGGERSGGGAKRNNHLHEGPFSIRSLPAAQFVARHR